MSHLIFTICGLVGVLALVFLPLYFAALALAGSSFSGKADYVLKISAPTLTLLSSMPIVLLGGVIHQDVTDWFWLAVLMFAILCGPSMLRLLIDAIAQEDSPIYYGCRANGVDRFRAFFFGLFVPSIPSALNILQIHVPNGLLTVLLAQWLRNCYVGLHLKNSIQTATRDYWLLLAILGALALIIVGLGWLSNSMRGFLKLGLPKKENCQTPVDSFWLIGKESPAGLNRYSVASFFKLAFLGVGSRFMGIIGLLVIWFVAAHLVVNPQYTIRNPVEALPQFLGISSGEGKKNLVDNVSQRGEMLQAASQTLRSTFCGGIIGLAFGLSVAFLIYLISAAAAFVGGKLAGTLKEILTSPVKVGIFFVQSIPILIWLPVVALLFKGDEDSVPLAIAGLIVATRMIDVITRSDTHLAPELRNTLKINSMPFVRRLILVDRLPVFKSAVSGFYTAIPLAISGVLIGELTIALNGLGGFMYLQRPGSLWMAIPIALLCGIVSMIVTDAMVFGGRFAFWLKGGVIERK